MLSEQSEQSRTDVLERQLSENVSRGAAWLDSICPDWWASINLQELTLSDASYCILGQLHRSERMPPFWAMKCAVGRYQMYACGFDLDGQTRPDLPHGKRWQLLDSFWKREIAARNVARERGSANGRP